MSNVSYRPLENGLGTAVAKRTYLRKGETWGDLSERVALGNTSLHETGIRDYLPLQQAIANGEILTAGRHLQHGDIDQSKKNLELFSNCSTACTSFIKFLLLLNGSGVGRSYSDELMVVDWHKMPFLYCILSQNHPNYKSSFEYEGSGNGSVKIIAREDLNAYPQDPDLYHEVEDSREGWAKALEILETAAFENKEFDHYVFDFSKIREEGKPIGGMQGRPASGPLPLIYAFCKASEVKYNDMPIWKQTMFVDHDMAEVVANGGARRSSRICIKYWKDLDIEDFIKIKTLNPWMWSSNNSVGVDNEFWEESKIDGTRANYLFNLITASAFEAGTGEPGFLSLDHLVIKD